MQETLLNEKVRSHSHIAGKYLDAAHNDCNINIKIPQHVPLFFYNLSAYDCHPGFGKYKEDLTCIATTSERYISVTLGALRLLDSFRFMNASLDKVISNYTKEKF